ncbi:MAG: hypothetical protein ACRCTE_07595 [Cellulosilyticaceae bacterium]
MTNHITTKNKTKASTVITGFLLVAIPILIGLLVCFPAVTGWAMMSKAQIIKGVMIGLSGLPVLLFITIKGGVDWYKRWWTWTILALTIITLLLIVVLSKGI